MHCKIILNNVSIKKDKDEVAGSLCNALRALDSGPIGPVMAHIEKALTKSLEMLDNDVQKKLFVSNSIEIFNVLKT